MMKKTKKTKPRMVKMTRTTTAAPDFRARLQAARQEGKVMRWSPARGFRFTES